MVDPKVKEIGALLREEESELVDYSQIERRTVELGFPTSVRTLRFYVNEGILPPPLKQGKRPVYREGKILNLLLSIQLMKSRFQRSLTEVKSILEHLREDPETLADKCSILYEETHRGARLKRVEREWLVDAFFRTLTGQLTLYPRRRRGEDGPRQPGEVLLTEMVGDLERHGRWETGPDGELRWISPEATLDERASGRASGEGDRMSHNSSPSPHSGASSRPEVTPITPPEGATTVRTARDREEHFLRRFERNLRNIERVFHPQEKKYYPLKASSLDPEVDDPYQNVVEILKEHGIYDRELLDRLPHDRSTRYTIPPRGLFGRKPRFVIAGIVRSPIADLARLGGVVEPLSREALFDVIRSHTQTPGVYHVLGILSTVGWAAELIEHVPRSEEYALVLVSQSDHGGWNLAHSLPKKLEGLLDVFDPETLDEKVSRTFYWIVENSELQIPGGHVEVERALEALEVTPDVLDVALKQVEQENPRIKRVAIDGRDILKRDRY